jgi:hypothetical protein
MTNFVPDDFVPPEGLVTADFVLRPLGPEHNEADYDAWTTSIDHIRATPGFPDGTWPREMSLEDNLRDLKRHADDRQKRRGFTFTVLDHSGTTIGCVYVYPDGVQSWVRASHAHLDAKLYQAVTEWLHEAWPFDHVEYAERPLS